MGNIFLQLVAQQNNVALQVAIVCCMYNHRRMQQIFVSHKTDFVSTCTCTVCNMKICCMQRWSYRQQTNYCNILYYLALPSSACCLPMAHILPKWQSQHPQFLHMHFLTDSLPILPVDCLHLNQKKNKLFIVMNINNT